MDFTCRRFGVDVHVKAAKAYWVSKGMLLFERTIFASRDGVGG